MKMRNHSPRRTIGSLGLVPFGTQWPLVLLILTGTGCGPTEDTKSQALLEETAQVRSAGVLPGVGISAPAKVYFGDVTGDQATDLLTLEPSTRSLTLRKAIFPSTWESSPSEGGVTLAADTAPLSVVVRDMNGDGRADIVQMLQNGISPIRHEFTAGETAIRRADSTGLDTHLRITPGTASPGRVVGEPVT
jgi:hypothetical protein